MFNLEMEDYYADDEMSEVGMYQGLKGFSIPSKTWLLMGVYVVVIAAAFFAACQFRRLASRREREKQVELQNASRGAGPSRTVGGRSGSHSSCKSGTRGGCAAVVPSSS